MSTRSSISIHQKDGTIRSVYCHFDGYYEHNGVILYNFYDTAEKVNKLIDNGAISSLGSEIGKPHRFIDSYNGCTFYHRDRGEEIDISTYEVHDNDNPYEELEKDTQDYNYIFVEETGEWISSHWDDDYQSLKDALKEEKINVWMIAVSSEEQYQKLKDFYKEFGNPDMEIPEFREVFYEV